MIEIYEVEVNGSNDQSNINSTTNSIKKLLKMPDSNVE